MVDCSFVFVCYKKFMSIIWFIPFMLFAASPWCDSSWALAMGLIVSIVFQWSLPARLKNGSKILMQISIVGLGFALDPYAVQRAGTQSVLATFFGLIGIMVCGFIVARLLRVQATTGSLIASGTGICGGSAIAAMSPVVGASSAETAVALAAVFSLNAVALFIFPPLGHYLHLTPEQFGLWAAIAIHDTSSVVGAATQFHPDSVAVAITTKLTRALWIVPMVFGTSFVLRWKGAKTGDGSAKIPPFIIMFVAAVVLHAFLPDMPQFYQAVNIAGKSILKVAIFLIGAQLSRSMLRNVGARALAMAVVLWLVMGVSALAWVRSL